MKGGAAVFLDRDGVLIEDVGYRRDAAGLGLLPGTGAALRRLTEVGFGLVVVTNQSAIARGLSTHEEQARIHQRLAELLRAEGVKVDAWLLCPHHPTEGLPPFGAVACTCRKPQPGLLYEARDLLRLSLERCFLVGDRRSDVACAHRAGVAAVLVGTSHGDADFLRATGHPEEVPEHVAKDLAGAADWILRACEGSARTPRRTDAARAREARP